MSDLSNELVITDGNWQEFVQPPQGQGLGLIPRDYRKNPMGYYESVPAYSPRDLPLIPWEEMPERIEEMERTKSRLSDMRMVGDGGRPIPALDQNGQGYCWAYSVTACVQMLRCKANSPYVPLSGHSVACVIKDFRDQGGWGAAALDFITRNGVAPQSHWPAKSMSRRHNTRETWDEARKYRVTESWVDLIPPVYDREMTWQQVMTCLLNRIPVIGDFNWWGHSVCLLDPVDAYPNRRATDPSRYGNRLINSWTNNWGTLGMGVLTGSRAVPDGGAAPRVVVG